MSLILSSTFLWICGQGFVRILFWKQLRLLISILLFLDMWLRSVLFLLIFYKKCLSHTLRHCSRGMVSIPAQTFLLKVSLLFIHCKSAFTAFQSSESLKKFRLHSDKWTVFVSILIALEAYVTPVLAEASFFFFFSSHLLNISRPDDQLRKFMFPPLSL